MIKYIRNKGEFESSEEVRRYERDLNCMRVILATVLVICIRLCCLGF